MSAPPLNLKVGQRWGKWGTRQAPYHHPPYRGGGVVGQAASRPTLVLEVGQVR